MTKQDLKAFRVQRLARKGDFHMKKWGWSQVACFREDGAAAWPTQAVALSHYGLWLALQPPRPPHSTEMDPRPRAGNNLTEVTQKDSVLCYIAPSSCLPGFSPPQ